MAPGRIEAPTGGPPGLSWRPIGSDDAATMALQAESDATGKCQRMDARLPPDFASTVLDRRAAPG